MIHDPSNGAMSRGVYFGGKSSTKCQEEEVLQTWNDTKMTDELIDVVGFKSKRLKVKRLPNFEILIDLGRNLFLSFKYMKASQDNEEKPTCVWRDTFPN